jgi:hypothetical protein
MISGDQAVPVEVRGQTLGGGHVAETQCIQVRADCRQLSRVHVCLAPRGNVANRTVILAGRSTVSVSRWSVICGARERCRTTAELLAEMRAH